MEQQNIFQTLGLDALMDLRELFLTPATTTNRQDYKRALTTNRNNIGTVAPATKPSFMTSYQQQLSQLTPNNNPMKLQNNAMGVASRRSAAFKSGSTRKGTGQLGRNMRIKALNI